MEGGSYQWIKAGLSPLAGYLAAWNVTLYIFAVYGTIGPQLVNSIAYAFGAGGAWMMNSNLLLVATGGRPHMPAVPGIPSRTCHSPRWATHRSSWLRSR